MKRCLVSLAARNIKQHHDETPLFPLEVGYNEEKKKKIPGSFGEIRTILHYWYECLMVQMLWKQPGSSFTSKHRVITLAIPILFQSYSNSNTQNEKLC